jgi:hypothetical protein
MVHSALTVSGPAKRKTPTKKVGVLFRAGEEIRTPDVNLGKVALYH